MNNEKKKFRSLVEIEAEVMAEGQEWMRQRLEQKLQEQAREIGSPFSPRDRATDSPAKTKAKPSDTRRSGGR